MFRNVESHFAQVPTIQNQRSIFKRPCTHKTSGNCGRVYPIFCDIVYPGDTVSMTTSKVVRLQTLLTPILDNVYLDTYWFAVPLRLCWEHWKEFMGENTSSAWVPSVTYQVPTISSPSGGFAVGTLADHFGLPVNVQWSATDIHAPMALPFRAYALVMNEFFRDENVTDPLNIPKGDSNQIGTNGDSYINDVANGGMPFKAARYHDYWSSMLPAPQKNNTPVTFPLLSGTFAPVRTRINHVDNAGPVALSFSDLNSGLTAGNKYALNINATDANSGDAIFYPNSWTGNIGKPVINNLWADLSSTVGSVTVNQLRLAFQLQRYYERLASAGSRYIEVIKAMFNVTSPDGRLQRPEYLGGNRIPVQIHEVVNQAQSANDFLGDLGAMSRTSDIHADFQKSFTEHCVLLGLAVMRTDRSYAQGFEPFWLRKQTTDWYFPQFANIGEMPTPTCCLYATSTNMNNNDIFGYQEAWADLRFKENYITGELRPGIPNTLASWHLSDYYTSQPTLSDTWMREDVTNLDRCLAVTSTVSNQFFADFYFDSTWTRCLPMYSVPGLIDHH